MDRGAWWGYSAWVSKSQTWLKWLRMHTCTHTHTHTHTHKIQRLTILSKQIKFFWITSTFYFPTFLPHQASHCSVHTLGAFITLVPSVPQGIPPLYFLNPRPLLPSLEGRVLMFFSGNFELSWLLKINPHSHLFLPFIQIYPLEYGLFKQKAGINYI